MCNPCSRHSVLLELTAGEVMELISAELQVCMWQVWLTCDPFVPKARLPPLILHLWAPLGAWGRPCQWPAEMSLCAAAHLLSHVLSGGRCWPKCHLLEFPHPSWVVDSSWLVSCHLLHIFHLQSSSSFTFSSSDQILHLWEYEFPNQWNFLILLVSLTEVFCFEDQLPL